MSLSQLKVLARHPTIGLQIARYKDGDRTLPTFNIANRRILSPDGVPIESFGYKSTHRHFRSVIDALPNKFSAKSNQPPNSDLYEHAACILTNTSFTYNSFFKQRFMQRLRPIETTKTMNSHS